MGVIMLLRSFDRVENNTSSPIWKLQMATEKVDLK
jgi:hypothetical protein